LPALFPNQYSDSLSPDDWVLVSAVIVIQTVGELAGELFNIGLVPTVILPEAKHCSGALVDVWATLEISTVPGPQKRCVAVARRLAQTRGAVVTFMIL
jgi:hypothetical protein